MPEREPVPIVIVVFHREEDTRRMLGQLEEVTGDYSLIIVDNGFDDQESLAGFGPARHIKNEENVGAIRGINQGLDVAGGKYLAVLHNDLLIHEPGWLDHIVDFLERNPEAGLVGLAGRHTIKEDGFYEVETTVVDMETHPESYAPTWRFTEVATIDGLGWVMKNLGFRLDERFGYMHYYDLDLSLQYINAGYRVYVAGVRVTHLAEIKGRSTRDTNDYLKVIGGDDQRYYDEARGRFLEKWREMLPLTRGYRDEAFFYRRLDELKENMEELGAYTRRLEKEIEAKNRLIEENKAYARRVEEELKAKQKALDTAGSHIEALERVLRERDKGGAFPGE